jgi:hypothetical protein
VHYQAYGQHAAATKLTGRPAVILQEDEVTSYLQQCAHGNLGVRPQEERGSESKDDVASMMTSNALDFVSASTLIELNARSGSVLDTIQFTNSCADPLDSTCIAGNIELWDVRSLQGVDISVFRAQADVREARWISDSSLTPSQTKRQHGIHWHQDGPLRDAARSEAERKWRGRDLSGSLFRWNNGSHCRLSTTWNYCLACAGSELELGCAFKCQSKGWARPRERIYAYAPMPTGARALANDTVPSYGGPYKDHKDHEWFTRIGGDVSPLSLSTLWSYAWGPLVGNVPHLS